MTSPIKLLSKQLANQIAAGEVIERPASIVKECVENSLDAGATQISVKLHQAGTQSIVIQDNGQGIPKDELSLALMRHATSKITAIEDLNAVSSFGFRGEALASIAAVSHCELISKPKEQSEAWGIVWAPEKAEATLTPAAHPEGTTVIVRDLFYTVPARRRFLKSLKTEWHHIDETLKRFALSDFSTGFEWSHNDVDRCVLPACRSKSQRRARLVRCLGQRFATEAQEVNATAFGLRLTGWVAPPSLARRQADHQYCFINGRYVRDRLLTHAINSVLGTGLEAGRYPVYVLYLEIDVAEVDVNVHPTKQEVRFTQPRHVHDFLVNALSPEESSSPQAVMSQSPTQVRFTAPAQPYHHVGTPAVPPPVHTTGLGQVKAISARLALVLQADKVWLFDAHAALAHVLKPDCQTVQLPLPRPISAEEADFLAPYGFACHQGHCTGIPVPLRTMREDQWSAFLARKTLRALPSAETLLHHVAYWQSVWASLVKADAIIALDEQILLSCLKESHVCSV